MQATLREFEDWLEDSVPDAVMIGYEKALAKLEECLPFEDTLVSHKGWHTRADQSLQLVPATSCKDKFQLAIFGSKSSCRDQPTSPTNPNQFQFLGQVPATCSSKRFV